MKYFLKKLVPYDERRTRVILYCKTKGIELEKEFNPEIKRDMYIMDYDKFIQIKESYKTHKRRACYFKNGALMDLALKEIEKGFSNGSCK